MLSTFRLWASSAPEHFKVQIFWHTGSSVGGC